MSAPTTLSWIPLADLAARAGLQAWEARAALKGGKLTTQTTKIGSVWVVSAGDATECERQLTVLREARQRWRDPAGAAAAN